DTPGARRFTGLRQTSAARTPRGFSGGPQTPRSHAPRGNAILVTPCVTHPEGSMTRTRYRIFDTDYAYFLTCTVAWMPVFTRPESVAVILDSWRYLERSEELNHRGTEDTEKLKTDITQEASLGRSIVSLSFCSLCPLCLCGSFFPAALNTSRPPDCL